MNFFEETNGSLVFRENGETLMVTPWGENSLRIRSTILSDIEEGSIALLEPAGTNANIHIEDMHATIDNGKIKAELTV